MCFLVAERSFCLVTLGERGEGEEKLQERG